MKYADRVQAPPKVIELSTKSFDVKWSARPKGAAVACGLRTVGAGGVDSARANGGAYAKNLHPREEQDPLWEEAYNDALLREYVGQGICDPNDINKAPTWMRTPETESVFFTPEALRHLFDELQKVASQESPAARPLDDVELMQLVTLVAAGGMTVLPQTLQNSHRRHLRGLLEDLLVAREV